MDPYLNCTIDGKYHVLSLLGEGGLGSVYKAEQPELSRFVALKILHRSAAMDQDSRARFEREARVLGTLHHENIVQVYSFGMLPSGFPFMAMEYLEGKTLANLKSTLNAGQVVDIGIQICAAVDVAHKAGVIHRDLKPENVLLIEDGPAFVVKVLDFGLSRMRAEAAAQGQKLTETGCLIGSIHYMSPEVCIGQKADERSDVYSLGCVLYEVLSGQPPFECDNPIGMLHKHRTELPASLTEHEKSAKIPKPLELVVFKALQKRTEDRFQSMSEMREALELLKSGRERELVLDNISVGTQKKRGSALVLVGVTLVVLSMMGLVATKLSRQPALTEDEATPGILFIRSIERQIAGAQAELDAATDAKRRRDILHGMSVDRLELGKALSNAKRYRESNEAYKLALQAEDGDHSASLVYSRASRGLARNIVSLGEMGRWKEALHYFDEAIMESSEGFADNGQVDHLGEILQARCGRIIVFAWVGKLSEARKETGEIPSYWQKLKRHGYVNGSGAGQLTVTLAADILFTETEMLSRTATVRTAQDRIDLAAIYLVAADVINTVPDRRPRARTLLKQSQELLDETSKEKPPEWDALQAHIRDLEQSILKKSTKVG